jgi:hypothetical protein
VFCTDDKQWTEPLMAYRSTAFRLEQRPIYLHDLTDPDLIRWMAGDHTPRTTSEWSRSVEANTAAGKVMRRVRIFETPPTPYQQWLRWYSTINVDAGEIQTEITRPVADEHGLTTAGDWWLLDNELLIEFHFDPDTYQRTGIELTDDPERVEAAGRWWSIAVDLADKAAITT